MPLVDAVSYDPKDGSTEKNSIGSTGIPFKQMGRYLLNNQRGWYIWMNT